MPRPKSFTFLVLLIVCILSVPSTAQRKFVDQLEAKAEAGAFVSSNEDTPFWLRTNQFGIVPTESPAGFFSAGLRKKYVFFDSLSNKRRNFDWNASVNPVLTYNKSNSARILLPEAYASVRFRSVELYAGRRMELMGLGDSTLTSGFYSGSGNALPIPKIQIGTIGFTPLRFTRNFLALHVGFSHGWFGTNYLAGVRLHQKFIYLRLGKPKSASKFYLGLNHNVLWAGQGEYLKQHPELAVDGKLPSSWRFFPNVVFAYTSKKWYEKNGYGGFDSYRLGNHLGSYDVGFETKVRGHKLFIYHQHPFEDVSSMIFLNVPDGLYGVNLKPAYQNNPRGFRVTHLTLEFLTTKDQSGSSFYLPGSKFQGADNYFNHSQYVQGWSYQGSAIGTPFIAPAADMDQSKLQNPRFYPNNRVNVWYAGALAKLGTSWEFGLRSSISRNFGIPGGSFEPPRNQLSLMASSQYHLPRLKQTSIILRLGGDRGEVFTKNFGGYIGVSKRW
ncbi:capsule assembly Wzi family protein [Dyadobacter aurulentus]|uniref:capsule assembly Wzi family protein n=1 Tax=Dyadobacter sp. UC 10 TaxID=2605428 RepID=UPI0011F20C20|nr:capsule assembly Wzi family protein [Dyadobacter sp. UC 10]KAA0989587.1 capsule assembly Wzi family protein [Dyadobacter sp. UC 10]